MSTTSTAYFVSGGNRGLGFGIVSALAKRPNTTIFATARDPTKATDLQTLAKSNPNVHILKLESASVSDAKAAAEYIQKTTGGLDIVIANAGISDSYYNALETPVEVLESHFHVNVTGPLVLFQNLYPLLKARQTRKFVVISTGLASIKSTPELFAGAPVLGYGTSKAALNYVARIIHSEHHKEGFIVFPLNPGWVDTDMGRLGAETLLGPGQRPPVTVEQSVEGQLRIIDGATAESSGRFLSFDGEEWAW
ncbi:hypothetical protein HK097_007679 [Rhizophlyctis rosea]|uniref:NAD(P)-binding protein n=1 Tax=Rhizophlyctis rosea TaxID=64517 RepID=A0AAD5SD88_9FUNG|nr:hypothetical protein HK097_007679 [Rhizophlyctis rosea]